MTPGGIPIAGRTVKVPGLTVINAADDPRIALHPGDYASRRSKRPGCVVLHSTGGLDPQRVLRGAGPRGHALEIFDLWSGRDRRGGEQIHSAAPVVIDFDGTAYVGGDLLYTAAYHAKGINDHSAGIELCTTPHGEIYEATLDAAVTFVAALCEPTNLEDGLMIPFQVHVSSYRNGPLTRLERVNGDASTQADGHDFYGILGHRDQTGQRGRGDPGDEIYRRLVAAGAEPLDFGSGEDLIIGRQRQKWLNAADARPGVTPRPLVVDGLVGPASLAAARRQGFARWSAVPTA